jgi:hypothetical protein
VSRLRVINRVWRAAADELGAGDAVRGVSAMMKDPMIANSTRFALKNGEHTVRFCVQGVTSGRRPSARRYVCKDSRLVGRSVKSA